MFSPLLSNYGSKCFWFFFLCFQFQNYCGWLHASPQRVWVLCVCVCSVRQTITMASYSISIYTHSPHSLHPLWAGPASCTHGNIFFKVFKNSKLQYLLSFDNSFFINSFLFYFFRSFFSSLLSSFWLESCGPWWLSVPSTCIRAGIGYSLSSASCLLQQLHSSSAFCLRPPLVFPRWD